MNILHWGADFSSKINNSLVRSKEGDLKLVEIKTEFD